MQLSEHFTLEEMTFSDTAQRHGIDNLPDDHELENLKLSAAKMELVRNLLSIPISVTSAYRNWRVNELIGGVSTSSHCNGLAVDFKPIGLDHYEAAKKIEASGLQYDQLILEYGWIHLGFGPQMRRESLTKKSASSPYQKGLIN